MTVNIELLRRTLAHIEAHPDQWDQADWYHQTECGTAACFAGRAALLSGVRLIDIDTAIVVKVATLPPGVWETCQSIARTDWLHREDVDHVPVAARALLGLDAADADALFDGNNDLDDLREIVDRLCEHATTTPGES